LIFWRENFRAASSSSVGEADDRDGRGEVAVGGEVVERRDELAVGEITGGAKDDERAGFWNGTAKESFAKGIGGGVGRHELRVEVI
jgi:hypothetical protein